MIIFFHYNIKTIIILGDAIDSINNYKLLTDNIIIIDFYNNFVLKNNINTYYNLFDKVNYFIFYYKDYYENSVCKAILLKLLLQEQMEILVQEVEEEEQERHQGLPVVVVMVVMEW
jgi:hypothetical protein